ncbi:MAG: matrixin family metalloprotease [Polyangiaceae bacterium]
MMARRARAAVVALTCSSALFLAAPDGSFGGASALAFCRSTTCARSDCATDFDGCKTEGEPLWWATQCVSFSLQEDGSQHIDFEVFHQVASRCAAEWSQRECDGGGLSTMAFSEEEPAIVHRTEYNQSGGNANVIMFQDTKWRYEGTDNTLAKTTVTYDKETGEIFDADIELNHAYNEFTTGDDEVVYDLQSILTHEMGHFIGLDHTPDFAATMNAGYQVQSTELRDLAEDDLLALCAVYPPERDAKCAPTPRGGFSPYEGGVPPADGGCSLAPTRDGGLPDRPGELVLLLGLGAALGLRRREGGR